MAQQPPADVVQIDRSSRAFSDDEINRANRALSGQMPGYFVVPNVATSVPLEDVPRGDCSPTLAELKAHFAPLVSQEAASIEFPNGSRELVDPDSELRLYHVRHEDWSIDIAPITVLISMRLDAETVVASA